MKQYISKSCCLDGTVVTNCQTIMIESQLNELIIVFELH